MSVLYQSRVSPTRTTQRSQLSEADAVNIWIARWLRVPRVDILRRYDCDPRRLYEIWERRRFPASRERALKVLQELYPELDGTWRAIIIMASERSAQQAGYIAAV